MRPLSAGKVCATAATANQTKAAAAAISGSVRSERYAEGYSRYYDGASSRYAASDAGYSYASGRTYGGSYGNSEYRNGYATIYRQ